jgi:hypothetical protein
MNRYQVVSFESPSVQEGVNLSVQRPQMIVREWQESQDMDFEIVTREDNLPIPIKRAPINKTPSKKYDYRLQDSGAFYEYREFAEGYDVTLPKVIVSRVLTSKLAQSNLALGIDYETLWRGARELDLKKDMLVKVDPLSDKSSEEDSWPMLSQTRAGVESTASIPFQIDDRPPYVYRREINTVFWLGILTAKEFQDNKGKPTQDDVIKKSKIAAFGAFSLAMFAIDTNLSMHVDMGSFFASGFMGICWASLGFDAIEKAVPRNLVRHVQNKQLRKAGMLAMWYPVLEYDLVSSGELEQGHGDK